MPPMQRRGVVRRNNRPHATGMGDISTDISNALNTLETDASGAVTNFAGNSISGVVLGPYKNYIYAGLAILTGFAIVGIYHSVVKPSARR
jgi:hypothetical protein